MSRIARHDPDNPEAWDAPRVFADVPAMPARCLCSHPKRSHYLDRKGRPTCGSSVCGCIEYRPKESA